MFAPLFRKIFSILMTLLLIIGLGFSGFMGAGYFFKAVSGGFLSKWTSVGTPPGKAVSIQIGGSESASGMTVVKTADGKYYGYKPGLFAKWVETSWSFPKQTRLNSDCLPFDEWPQRPPLPHAIIDCRGSFTWEWQSTGEFYAVLDDGSVWRWRYGMGLIEGLVLMLVAAILGGLCGFLISKLIRNIILRKI